MSSVVDHNRRMYVYSSDLHNKSSSKKSTNFDNECAISELKDEGDAYSRNTFFYSLVCLAKVVRNKALYLIRLELTLCRKNSKGNNKK